jgi:hypothetical protein
VHVFANAMWFNQYTQQFAYKNGQVPVRVCACVCVRVLFDLHESVYVCVCVCVRACVCMSLGMCQSVFYQRQAHHAIALE